MIKDKDLREKDRLKYSDGKALTLENIQIALTQLAKENGIKVAFCRDQVKSGNVFNSDVENCLIVYHPEHRKDYISTVIRVKHQGRHGFLFIDDYGVSKMSGKMYAATDGRKEAKAERQGMSMSERVGAAIGSSIVLGIGSIGANKKQYEEEQTWYTVIDEIIEELCK